GTPHEQVIGLIAGGHQAIFRAVENAEDKPELGEQDLKNINFNQNDVLVGIAASGRTPYVLGAMKYARALGATVAAISCNPDSPVSQAADIA
ncbi:SIS domain-containing protein, partial [Enterobacter cloacae complex sp.6722787]